MVRGSPPEKNELGSPPTIAKGTTHGPMPAPSVSPSAPPSSPQGSPPDAAPLPNLSSLGGQSSSAPDPTTGTFQEDHSNAWSDDQGESSDDGIEMPLVAIEKLEELLGRPRWIVPVLPKQELETLLEAAIRLVKKDLHRDNMDFHRFLDKGLQTSFLRLMNDEAVKDWKPEIQSVGFKIPYSTPETQEHKYIFKASELVLHLIVLLIPEQDTPQSVWNILALIFEARNKYHHYNAYRSSELTLESQEPFAVSPPGLHPKGWLVDLLNKFGLDGGFDRIRERFENAEQISCNALTNLLKPFGGCSQFLRKETIANYLLPAVKCALEKMKNLTQEEIKSESNKTDLENNVFIQLAKSTRALCLEISELETEIERLEVFRLQVTLTLLQTASFAGRIQALDEFNSIVSSSATSFERDWRISREKILEWLREKEFISLTLKDNLHLPAYVERLEKIVRQLLRCKAVTVEDLDQIWCAQSGKHDAIQRNLHELFAKCAWEFNSEQLEHLFEHFKASWRQADGRERSLLLELVRRLAEDDKEGQMADKALNLLWDLARDPQLPAETMDQALSSHLKILDSITLNRRDSLKEGWIRRCIDVVKSESDWTVPALRQMEHIFLLFQEQPLNVTHMHGRMKYRSDLVSDIQSEYMLCALLSKSLRVYMERIRQLNLPLGYNSDTYSPDGGRTTHSEQLRTRLGSLQFILREGRLWLCNDQAVELWDTLVVNSVFPSDRDIGFSTFSSLLRLDDFDPDTVTQFFQSKVLHLDPSLLTVCGLDCFENFFKVVNVRESRLIDASRRSPPALNALELIGQEYLWRTILSASENVSHRAITLFRDYYSTPSAELVQRLAELHSLVMDECFSRLRVNFDTLKLLGNEKDSVNKQSDSCTKMTRVLKVLIGYIRAYDDEFSVDRTRLPLYRAALGRCFRVKVKVPSPGRTQLEDRVLEVLVHSSQALAALRKEVLDRFLSNQKAASGTRLELCHNNRPLDQSLDDRKCLEELDIHEHSQLALRLGSTVTAASSPDSSADSSPTRSPTHEQHSSEEFESLLPGTVLSKRHDCIQFLISIADLGSRHQRALADLTYARQLLRGVPADERMVRDLEEACNDKTLHLLFFGDSPTRVLYYLELAHALLLPAVIRQMSTATFQELFFEANGLEVCLAMLTQNNFLHQADADTRNAASYWMLRLLKFHLYVSGRLLVGRIVRLGQHSDDGGLSIQARLANAVLNAIIEAVPAQHDVIFRQVCDHLSRSMLTAGTVSPLLCSRTEYTHMEVLIKMAWAAGSGQPWVSHTSSADDIQRAYAERQWTGTAERLCHEALDVLALAVALCPNSEQCIMRADELWKRFLLDILFSRMFVARARAADTLIVIVTKVSMQSRNILGWALDLLFGVLFTKVNNYPETCKEYFHLIFKLLEFCRTQRLPVNDAQNRLKAELDWLDKAKQHTVNNSEAYPQARLLEGHLTITKELIEMLDPQEKWHYGCSPDGPNLVTKLLEDFLLPSSKIYVEQKACSLQRSVTMAADISSNQTDDSPSDSASSMHRSATTCMAPSRCVPVCGNAESTAAAFDVVIALCAGCLPNLNMVAKALIEMYYSDPSSSVTDWEYAPTVALRGPGGFVGLKNGGATCYMNSVFQQLFMVERLRESIMSAGTSNLELEDSEGEEPLPTTSASTQGSDDLDPKRAYVISMLRCVQLMFANLIGSQLQFYVPRKFWKQFKFSGQTVNLREQQDALEFFNALVDVLDEALAAINEAKVGSALFGGMFADQKICKTCPHRYQREEPFTSLSVDVRSHSNLSDSLQEYVKGDLLESDNAYYCEKCEKKVDAIKRLCIWKAPPILAIQLKRFDFDWEREAPVKFNDYFEFPHILDMEPYTVQGLATREGETIAPSSPATVPPSTEYKYRLRGVIVHSGQANGGHYFSYILTDRRINKWYKFDDGDVSECEMHNDEEMRSMCFGGDYPTEVFDHISKRYQSRRQKRWWNAYILFYEKMDSDEIVGKVTTQLESMSLSTRLRQMPSQFEAIVRRKNTKFVHERNQYTPEYFQFIRQLCAANLPYIKMLRQEDANNLALTSLRLLSQFLFTTGLHAKKALRGTATEWVQTLNALFQYGKNCRVWFTNDILLDHPSRFCEYLLESTSAEVRGVFGKIVLYLIQSARNDPVEELNIRNALNAEQWGGRDLSVSDYLIKMLLNLPQTHSAEFGRHPSQYFTLFSALASSQTDDKLLLLRHGALTQFVTVVIEEFGFIRSMYAETSKCFSTIGLLLRACSVEAYCKTINNTTLPPNPFYSVKDPLLPLCPNVAKIIYQNDKFCKVMLEQATGSDETRQIFQFLCWENWNFSQMFGRQTLWQVFYGYNEIKQFLGLWLIVMEIEDSFQKFRINVALKGDDTADNRGLFAAMAEHRARQPRRSYLVLKMLVRFFGSNAMAREMMAENRDLKRQWTNVCQWLHTELDSANLSRAYQNAGSSYYYSTASSSNENHVVGNYLERTQSAMDLLEEARGIIEIEECDEVEMEVDARSEPDEFDQANYGTSRPDYPDDPPPPYTASVRHSQSAGGGLEHCVAQEPDGIVQSHTDTEINRNSAEFSGVRPMPTESDLRDIPLQTEEKPEVSVGADEC